MNGEGGEREGRRLEVSGVWGGWGTGGDEERKPGGRRGVPSLLWGKYSAFRCAMRSSVSTSRLTWTYEESEIER